MYFYVLYMKKCISLFIKNKLMKCDGMEFYYKFIFGIFVLVFVFFINYIFE